MLKQNKPVHMDYYERILKIPDFPVERRVKDDPLRKLLDMCYIARSPAMKVIFMIASFMYFLIISMDLYILLSTFDFKNLLKYGGCMGVQIFFAINLYILLVTYDESFEIGLEIQRISIVYELFEKDVLSQYTGMLATVKIVTYINLALAIFTSLGCFGAQDNLNDQIYLRVWTCQNFSRTTCSIVGYLLSLMDTPVIVCTVTAPFVIVYYQIIDILHLRYLNECIKTICKSSLPEEELYTSEVFQRLVGNKLKICIIMHQKFVSFCVQTGEIIYTPILLVVIGSIILGCSMLLFLISPDFLQLNLFCISLSCGMANCLLCTWLYVYFSERMINESEYSHYLLSQLPWYYMNKDNVQIYSVFLRRAAIPISMKTDLLEINILLFVRVVKSLYSMAAVILRFQSNLGGN